MIVYLDTSSLVKLYVEYDLRGFDGVHLAAAKLLASADADVHVAFSSFDERLNKAARSEGFVVLAVGAKGEGR